MLRQRILRALVLALVVTLPPAASAGPLEDADTAYNRRDYATALKLYMPLADAGNPEAQFSVGIMYSLGFGVARSPIEAARLWRLAAANGHARAAHLLAHYAVNGILDGQPNEAEAFRWDLLAAELGLPIAQLSVGIGLFRGEGTPRDVVAGYAWVTMVTDYVKMPNPPPGIGPRVLAIQAEFAAEMTPKQITDGEQYADVLRARFSSLKERK